MRVSHDVYGGGNVVQRGPEKSGITVALILSVERGGEEGRCSAATHRLVEAGTVAAVVFDYLNLRREGVY